MRYRWWLIAAVAATTGCSEEPIGAGAKLTLTIDAVGARTNQDELTVTGTVIRAPATTAPILVRATGGLESSIDTVTDGQFSVVATLHPNVTNSITLTATDDQGSAAGAATFTILHDGAPPTIIQATPADNSDAVATGTLIQVRLSEPVGVLADGGIRLDRQGVSVAGTTTVSSDSLTLSFTPSVTPSPNAIYRISFVGVSDRAGNAISFGTSTCFVTSPQGATASLTAADPSDDWYSSAPPPSIAAPDLIAARFAREGELFSGVFRFTGPRSFARDGIDRAEIFVELDTDQDSTTGFVTLKDTLFLNSGSPLDTLTSGTRAEYLIGLSPLAAEGDNAYVGRYTAQLNFQVMATFQPGVCGSFMSFAIPFSAVDDDGKLNAVVMGYAGSGNSIFVDPMPTKGSFELDFPPVGPVAMRSSAANHTGGYHPFHLMLDGRSLRARP